jgi:hypothetical protein
VSTLAKERFVVRLPAAGRRPVGVEELLEA